MLRAGACGGFAYPPRLSRSVFGVGVCGSFVYPVYLALVVYVLCALALGVCLVLFACFRLCLGLVGGGIVFLCSLPRVGRRKRKLGSFLCKLAAFKYRAAPRPDARLPVLRSDRPVAPRRPEQTLLARPPPTYALSNPGDAYRGVVNSRRCIVAT